MKPRAEALSLAGAWFWVSPVSPELRGAVESGAKGRFEEKALLQCCVWNSRCVEYLDGDDSVEMMLICLIDAALTASRD
jgi:hypothetical protein